MISSTTKLCVGIGDPIYKSLGPIIHNAGLKAVGLSDEIIYVSVNVKPNLLENFIKFARESNICGITATLPHKEAIMALIDEVDTIADEIGAVNTVVNEDGKLVGSNTDWIGAVEPLKALTSLADKNVAIIGAGGAAKAFAYGLTREKAIVTIYNRTSDRAKGLAEKFGCKYTSLDHISEIKKADIICNASSIGFSGSDQSGKSPVPGQMLNSNQIIFDAVYSPLKTEFLQQAEAARAKIISGTEMLLYQGFAQFEKYYQKPAPKDAMRSALMDYLKNAK